LFLVVVKLFIEMTETEIEILKTLRLIEPAVDLTKRVAFCPSGHMYVIENCGGPIVESHCAVCGAIIGGSSYNLAAGNSRLTQEDLRNMGL